MPKFISGPMNIQLGGGYYTQDDINQPTPTATLNAPTYYGSNAKDFSENVKNNIASEAWEAQEKAMNFNAIQAAKARDWQEKMYGSRFQKTIADIKKAGLNPYILNMFSPGGFGSGGAASIYSNIAKQYNESKNKNTNKKEMGNADWIIPLIGMGLGAIMSMVNPAFGAIGGAFGSLAARKIRKK